MVTHYFFNDDNQGFKFVQNISMIFDMLDYIYLYFKIYVYLFEYFLSLIFFF